MWKMRCEYQGDSPFHAVFSKDWESEKYINPFNSSDGTLQMVKLKDTEVQGSPPGSAGAVGEWGSEHEQQEQLAWTVRTQGKVSPMCNALGSSTELMVVHEARKKLSLYK